MATISNGESGSSVRTKLNDIINKVEGVTSINNNIDVTGTVTADGLTVDGSVDVNGATSFDIQTTNSNPIFERTDAAVKLATRHSGTTTTQYFTDTDGSLSLRADPTNALLGSFFNITVDGDQAFRIADNGDISFYEDTGTTAKFFWDASAESLGIGTSSPSGLFHAKDSSSSFMFKDVSGNAKIFLDGSNGDFAGGDYMEIEVDSSPNLMFKQAGTERMRIDSSGNLLVGKTSVGYTIAGAQIEANGVIGATVTNNQPMFVNRLSTDGALFGFYKDGALVGSIASRLGVVSSIILDPRTGGAGLTGGGPGAIIPTGNTGASTDGAADLGNSTGRWKDLYLSGGVYLGGTGAANLLDDYEEGTWTPTLSASSTAPTVSSYSDRVGRYVKVGRMVTAMCQIRANLSSAGSGYPIVTGLPFTSQNIYFMGASVGLQNLFTTAPKEGFVSFQGTSVRFDNATYQTGVNNYICFNITYEHD